MKQMVRSQSDNFARLQVQFLGKSPILFPSPQKRNVSLEFKLKAQAHATHEKPLSPESSSKLSSLNSIDDIEFRSPLKMTKSVSNIEKKSSLGFQRKDASEALEELWNLRSTNPHQKNFEEFAEKQTEKTKEIDEAQDEEEEDEDKKEKMSDFDRFLNDIDDK